MRVRHVLLLFILLFGCAKRRRTPPKPKPKQVKRIFLTHKAKYTLNWQVLQGDNPVITADVTAVTDGKAFHMNIEKQSTPEGVKVVHRLDVIKTNNLFTRVDGGPMVKWSSFIDEDKALWDIGFGDIRLILNAFSNCFYVINNQIKTAGNCKPVFPDGLRGKELAGLWKDAGKKAFKIEGIKKDGLWKKLGITLQINDLTMSMDLTGDPTDTKVKAPAKWIPDHRSRPWILLKNIKKQLKGE